MSTRPVQNPLGTGMAFLPPPRLSQPQETVEYIAGFRVTIYLDGSSLWMHPSGSAQIWYANGDVEIVAARDYVTDAKRFTRIQTSEDEVHAYYQRALVAMLKRRLTTLTYIGGTPCQHQ